MDMRIRSVCYIVKKNLNKKTDWALKVLSDDCDDDGDKKDHDDKDDDDKDDDNTDDDNKDDDKDDDGEQVLDCRQLSLRTDGRTNSCVGLSGKLVETGKKNLLWNRTPTTWRKRIPMQRTRRLGMMVGRMRSQVLQTKPSWSWLEHVVTASWSLKHIVPVHKSRHTPS